MITFKTYHLLADAWEDGVADWCRAASGHVLSGGRAWLVTPGDGHANGLKRRLLRLGVTLAGVQFLDARNLRRELCARFGVEAPTLGRETLELLLRLRLLETAPGQTAAAAARQNLSAGLRALEDFAAAGWEQAADLPADLRPDAPARWLDFLRETGSWIPEIDRLLLEASGQPSPQLAPLSICVCGWDATFWPQFGLLRAALQAAQAGRLFVPLPRGNSELVQEGWVSALEEALGVAYTVCPSSGFVSAQAALAARLEGVDLAPVAGPAAVAAPELLVGVDWQDAVRLARDFVARWLVDRPAEDDARLAIVAPARNGSAVSLVRALAEAGVALEDELGEMPEPPLAIQILRAMVDYYQDGGTAARLLLLLELLNEHAAAAPPPAPVSPLRAFFPIDLAAARHAFGKAFAELQDNRVRVLCGAAGFTREPVAAAVRALVAHLGEWPDPIGWDEALARLAEVLAGFGLSTEAAEPGWSRLTRLRISQRLPLAALWDHLARVLSGVASRRPATSAQRFARVVVTTLEGTAGQAWGGVLFLDANEAVWPVFPVETPFLDDLTRKRLNARREIGGDGPPRGHLLTSADRAQLDQFRFLEILENCAGPLAFAAPAHDPVEVQQELYPNEWVLRALVESAPGETPLARWRQALRGVPRALPPLAPGEAGHLRVVFASRRDPQTAFDAALFDYTGLDDPEDLPWSDPWSARDLEAAWHRPATLALRQIFGVEAGPDGSNDAARAPKQVIGKLVHQWVRTALGGSKQPRRFGPPDWERSLATGLTTARLATERGLRAALCPAASPPAALPLWWQGILRKSEWAARSCLQSLANLASANALGWVAVDAQLPATLRTPGGPLRLRASCDVLLLDGPQLDGSACQLVDLRTGSKKKPAAASGPKTEQGEGIPLAAALLAALDQGADSAGTQAGFVEPRSVEPGVLSGAMQPALVESLGPLAARQNTLRFGQRALALSAAHGQERGEKLPLATTLIEADVLLAKEAAATCSAAPAAEPDQGRDGSPSGS